MLAPCYQAITFKFNTYFCRFRLYNAILYYIMCRVCVYWNAFPGGCVVNLCQEAFAETQLHSKHYFLFLSFSLSISLAFSFIHMQRKKIMRKRTYLKTMRETVVFELLWIFTWNSEDNMVVVNITE